MKRLFNSFLPIIPYAIVFVFSLYVPSDPDLGWHLKYGEYFWQHGQVLRDNTFSTMMPNYHWGNTSWFTDVISYTAYHLGGFAGVILLGAAVVTATFYFFAKASQLNIWEETFIFPVLLYLEEPINAVSFRGQQLTLLLVGVMFYLISFYKEKPKTLWFAVPLFFLWANVHGEFVLGFVVFGMWLVIYLAQKLLHNTLQFQGDKSRWQSFLSRLKVNYHVTRKEILTLTAIVLASILVTFINPFGYVLHHDAISHIGSPLLKDIAEYLPFDMYSTVWWAEIFTGMFAAVGMAVLYFNGKLRDKLPLLGGGLLLFILSLSVRRYAWPAYYLLMPLFPLVAVYFKPDSKKFTNLATIILAIGLVVVAVWWRWPIKRAATFTWTDYCNNEVLKCSPKSAEFLIDHHLTHDLLTLYGWGGWLIWNYPQIKPSIDGRMHLWSEHGYSAFTDYYSLEQDMKDVDKSKYNVVYMSTDKPVYNRLVTLTKQNKWAEVYQDNDAAIFVREDR